MGIDIHGRLQQLNDQGEWSDVDTEFVVSRNGCLVIPGRTYISKRRQKRIDALRSDFTKRYCVNLEFFDFRSSDIFGWLADVNNIAEIPSLNPTNVILPIYDYGYEDSQHAYCLNIEDLINFDYKQTFEYRRNGYGDTTCEAGKGLIRSYKWALHYTWKVRLKFLKTLKTGRMLFWFD